MYSLTKITNSTAKQYKHMTPPNVQHLLGKLDDNNDILAIGANYSTESNPTQPIGLTIAKINYQHESIGDILLFFVAPSHRNYGVGTELLKTTEEQLSQRGCQKIRLMYVDNKSTTSPLEKVLKNCQWESPCKLMILCQAKVKTIMNAPWVHKYTLPEEFTIFPWDKLPQSDRIAIEQQSREQWYPEEFFPLENEESIEPENSLGLRYKGELIGWTITHRISDDTIKYSTLFVRKEFQKMGRAISLLAEAIRRHNHTNIPQGFFEIDPENKPMCRFVQRHMTPYLSSITSINTSVKLL